MKKILMFIPAVLLFSCSGGQTAGTISVSGRGEVTAVPDTAQLYVTVSEKAETTRAARKLTNGKIDEALAALEAAGVADKDLQTSAIRFSNDYEWDNEARRNVLAGQIVSQTLTVRFRELDDSPEILAAALDALGGINGIEIGNLQFSLSDPQSLYVEARRLAFEKARQKAGELASYAGIDLGKAVNITESGSSPVYPLAGNAMVQRNVAFAEYDSAAPSEIPGGEISITYDISVVFQTE